MESHMHHQVLPILFPVILDSQNCMLDLQPSIAKVSSLPKVFVPKNIKNKYKICDRLRDARGIAKTNINPIWSAVVTESISWLCIAVYANMISKGDNCLIG